MTLEQAQTILFDLAELGIIEYQPPYYSMGPGAFIIDGERIPTNSSRLPRIALGAGVDLLGMPVLVTQYDACSWEPRDAQ